MVARIATFQEFQSGVNNMLRLTSEVNDSYIRMSSGKRVINPGDDPVAMNSILNYTHEIKVSTLYRDNINLANRRLSQEEAAIQGVESLLFVIKNKVLQGNNGAYANTDRLSIAQELERRFSELVNIANRRDESGEYIFAGFQSDVFLLCNDLEIMLTI